MQVFYQQSIFLLLPIFIFLVSMFMNYKTDDFKITESSVWCHKGFNDQKMCKFKNVCYDSNFKTFLFFLNNKSVINGIDHYNELQKIELSSITHHNFFFANVTMIELENYNIEKRIDVVKQGMLFSRFKPDNIMHCIHDDLFPLYMTLEKNCGGDEKCFKDFMIVLHDRHPKGPFFELYKLFSSHAILHLTDLNSDSNVVCFKELITGLSQESLFFQYGFDKPHGPINNSGIRQNDVVRFTNFLREHIYDEKYKTDVILFSRQKSRRILNEVDVLLKIQNFYKKLFNREGRITVGDLASNPSIISSVFEADLLVGMHGAEMILGLFMKPNSIIIELFPFGIQPNFVSFLKPAMNLKGNQQIYISWRNDNRNNSVFHPDNHPLMGGINHLPKALQNEIKNTEEIPPVKCCNDPAYLYFMFQDTWVGNNFDETLEKLLKNYSPRNLKIDFVKDWIFPSILINLTCNFNVNNKKLFISWNPPFNAANKKIEYNIFVAGENMNFKKEIITSETQSSVEVTSNETKFKLWILSVFTSNSVKSADQVYDCG